MAYGLLLYAVLSLISGQKQTHGKRTGRATDRCKAALCYCVDNDGHYRGYTSVLFSLRGFAVCFPTVSDYFLFIKVRVDMGLLQRHGPLYHLLCLSLRLEVSLMFVLSFQGKSLLVSWQKFLFLKCACKKKRWSCNRICPCGKTIHTKKKLNAWYFVYMSDHMSVKLNWGHLCIVCKRRKRDSYRH